MGMAMAVYKIYPKEGHDINALFNELQKHPRVKSLKKEPIAFGLELIKIGVLMDDKKDKPEEIEADIRRIDGIGEMECEDVTLIS
ncbi:MAG: hypothetical protein QXO69_00715 [archaeon]